MKLHEFLMFFWENIAIFAILLRYFNISVNSFVKSFGYYISVVERRCTIAVYTYILPGPGGNISVIRRVTFVYRCEKMKKSG